jgi:hypothetical protein
MKNSVIIILSILVLLITSCSTEIEINDEWQAIPVVYGILDKNSTEHYIKVNKAFLGDLPASTMAQYSDSLFYDNVEVSLYRKLPYGEKQYVCNFAPTDEFPKDSGYFANDRNTIYKASDIELPATQAGESYEYQLEVYIADIDRTVTSETELISGTVISSPSSSPMALISVHNYSQDFTYTYETGTNGRVFQMIIQFNYLEVSAGDTIEKNIVWPQPVKVIDIGNSSVTVQSTFSVMAFYNLLISNIPKDDNVQRLVKMPNSIDFRLAAGDDNFSTYMQISAPATGIAQSKPLFTNITNGIGLFASNINVIRSKRVSPITLDTLHRGIYTKDLSFVERNNPYYTQTSSK